MSKLTTEEYLEYLGDNTGHVNKNPYKTLGAQPDYGGFLKVEGKIYKVAGWIKPKTKSLTIKITRYNEL